MRVLIKLKVKVINSKTEKVPLDTVYNQDPRPGKEVKVNRVIRIWVNNGEDALSAAVSFKPDLILLDAMMPKISGFDVLDILRNTPETTNIRVIMLTALSQPKDKERAEQLGVDDYGNKIENCEKKYKIW